MFTKIFFLITLLSQVFGISVVFATPTSSSTSVNASTTLIEAISETDSVLITSSTENSLPPTIKERALPPEAQQRTKNLAANVSNRMDAVVDRLFNIVARTESRIKKQKEAGYDTQASESALRTAVQSLSQAQANLSNIDTLVNSATASINPYSNWILVKAKYQSTKEQIQVTKIGLQTSITALKNSPLLITSSSTPNN